MLKIIFWILLLANGALLALNLGALDAVVPDGREPQRMQRQIHPEQLELLAPEAKRTALPANPVEVASVAPVLIACTEIGNFPLAEAKRFEAQIAELALGERQSRHNVSEVASYMVYIPSQGGQAAAQKKVVELRGRGVTNLFIMQENASPDLRWGISLGIFKSEAAARNQLAALKLHGVQSARIGARSMATSNVVFQMRNLDLAAKTALERIGANFPKQQLRNCE